MLSLLVGIATGVLPLWAGDLGDPVDVSFRAAVDGTTQKYVRLLPATYDATKPYDVLLAFHGHGADRWQYVKAGRGECKGARDVAARHGMIFVAPRRHGWGRRPRPTWCNSSRPCAPRTRCARSTWSGRRWGARRC